MVVSLTFISPVWAVSPKTTDEIYNAVTTSQTAILNYFKSKPSMSTSGTDYYPDETARIFLRLVDGNSRPINLGNCNATLYFPNNSKVFTDSTMTLLEKGFYYKDFITPGTLGNYIVSFDCATPNSPFFQNISYGNALSIPANTPLYASFGFDNSNNLTVTNSPKLKVTGSGAKYNLWFNGNLVINNGGATNTTPITTMATISPSQFGITENQPFVLECLTGCPYMLNWISLNLTFSMLTPQDMIRGQNEVHIRNSIVTCPSTSDIWTYPNRNLTYYPTENPFNEDNIINNITYSYNSLANQLISVNETVKNINSTIIIPNFTANSTDIAKAVIDRLIAWRDIVFPRGLYLW